MPACRHFSESSWKALAVMVRMGMVWAFRQLSIGLLGNFKGNGNDKGGANAHLAGHLNGAVHLVDQALYNGHAQSGIAAPGAVNGRAQAGQGDDSPYIAVHKHKYQSKQVDKYSANVESRRFLCCILLNSPSSSD